MDELIKEYIDLAAKESASETVRALRSAGALKDQRSIIHKRISTKLTEFYKHDQSDENMKRALKCISEDEYFDIIPLFYYVGNTIEHIASAYDVDLSTITRNKRRLCYEINELLESYEGEGNGQGTTGKQNL